ncbi:LPS export ABC transporter periplasmic protein LptC [Candidatus Pelagibacter sp.]|jgi:hypothetical protein|nr:LPS export ABC transporter periplasmic protein LptC [Candidatus Pelagibacter sp.]|tara:strand:- start:1042 stop:1638 length:597 start_codon:yes stop_codon:yes gene_type:complete
MNKKIITQLILFFIILLFFSLFYFKYFLKIQDKSVQLEEIDSSLNLDVNSSNIIENIEYISEDNLGNKYIIKAKYGEILDENSDLILMKNVDALVISNNHEEIIIRASSATYNIINYDTNFRENIIIKYAEHKIICDSTDLLFNDHKIKLYDNISYNNLYTNILADIIEINLLTKDLKIYMNNQNKKIQIIHKNNVNN